MAEQSQMSVRHTYKNNCILRDGGTGLYDIWKQISIFVGIKESFFLSYYSDRTCIVNELQNYMILQTTLVTLKPNNITLLGTCWNNWWWGPAAAQQKTTDKWSLYTLCSEMTDTHIMHVPPPDHQRSVVSTVDSGATDSFYIHPIQFMINRGYHHVTTVWPPNADKNLCAVFRAESELLFMNGFFHAI